MSADIWALGRRTCTRFLLLDRVGSLADNPVGNSGDETAWVKQVLWAEGTLRPPESWFELHAQEVPDFSIDTVTHPSLQLAFGVTDLQRGLKRYGIIDL